MDTETLRIANQLRQIFNGEPWYGHSFLVLIDGISAEDARGHQIAGVHSVWELVLHMELWARIAADATLVIAMPALYGTEKDWLEVEGGSPAEWVRAKEKLFETIERVAQAMEAFGDGRLQEMVPGRQYDFSYLFYGVAQHCVYHSGQIAMLRAVSSS